MICSSIHFLDRLGRVVLGRDYRGDIASSLHLAAFFALISPSSKEDEDDRDDPGALPPVVHQDGITYVYLTKPSYYLVAMSRRNSNVVALTLFLHKTVNVHMPSIPPLPSRSLHSTLECLTRRPCGTTLSLPTSCSTR